LQLAAEGHGVNQPPDNLRDRVKRTMAPLPIWYEPFEDGNVDIDEYPIHALTQRPMHMYHSWGTQNAWLRQITGKNYLYLPTKIWEEHGFTDGDYAKVSSVHGSIIVPVAHHAGLNPHTVWTWNAIGKRKGAWALDEKAPEATKGFLLNHLISELQPPKGDGMRWANSDPVTGQAAWFDLRVKIEKAEPKPPESQPAFPPIKSPVGKGPKNVARKI
jgi:anaerobic selenocysteine-containing dehydrogenase